MQTIKSTINKILIRSGVYLKTDMTYLVRGSFWLFLNQIFAIVFSALLSVAFANLISAQQYGIYKYIISVSAIISAFSLTGMNTAIVRSVAMGNEGFVRKSFWYQLKWNTLIITSLAVITCAYYYLRGNTLLALGILIIGIFVPLTNAANTFSAYLSGTKRYKSIFFINLCINGTSALLLFSTIFFFQNILVLVTIYFATNAITYTAAYLYTLHSYKLNTHVDHNTKSLGTHLSIINFFGIISQNIDKIFAFQFLGATPLAIYSFAVSVPAQFGGVAKMISTLAFPKISERYATSQKVEYKDKIIKLIILFGFFATLYYFAAPFIYHIFFPQYIVAINYSRLAAVIFIFTAPNLYLLNILQIKADKKILYRHSLVTAIVQTCLMALLGYTYGITGLIVAHICSTLVSTLYSLYLLKTVKVVR